MAPGYVAIEKSTDWQGRRETWSNVYWLDNFPTLSEEDGQDAIDSILALERAVHHSSVRFDRAVVYRKGGLAGLEGLALRDGINLQGQQASGAVIYRECAVLVKFELPRSGLSGFGRFRQLMKWLHVCEVPTSVTSAQYNGQSALSAAYQTEIMTKYATPLRTQQHGPGRLSNENGDLPTGSAVHPYLEHRQFHQGRKER